MQSNNCEIEFCARNRARILVEKPQQINTVKFIGQIKKDAFLVNGQILAVSFHNQLNLYRVQNNGAVDFIKDYFVADVREEITCIEREGNSLHFGGRLGLLYVHDLASEDQMVVCRGHWREITGIKTAGNFAFTSSADNSVRLWEVTKGLQVGLFLDSLKECSNVISLDLRFDLSEFLTLDLCQNLRVWQIDLEYLHKVQTVAGKSEQFHENSHEILRMYHTPKHSIFKPMKQITDAQYLAGTDCLLLSSPSTGIAVVLPTTPHEFQILKVFPFQTSIFDEQIQILQHNQCVYMPLADEKLVELNLKTGKIKSMKFRKITQLTIANIGKDTWAVSIDRKSGGNFVSVKQLSNQL